jgi:hypothetical protein
VGTTTLANSSGRIALPVVAASGSNVVVSWIAGSSGALRTRVSTDRAAHWNPTATPAASSTGYFHVAVRGTRIALAWTTSTDLVLRQRINGTWTTPATLSTPDAGETGPYAPAVAIQAANRIAVSWTEELDNGYGDLRWIESPDGGATWFKAESIYRGTSSTVRRINDYVSIAWPTEGSRYLVWNGWTPNTNSYRLYLRRGTGTPVGPLSAASEWRPSTAVQRASVDGVQPRWGAAEGR